MGDPDVTNATLQPVLDRLAAGDEKAADDLIAHSKQRVRLLARRLLRDDPAVRRWEQTDDVLQNALLRLHGRSRRPGPRRRGTSSTWPRPRSAGS